MCKGVKDTQTGRQQQGGTCAGTCTQRRSQGGLGEAFVRVTEARGRRWRSL